MKLKLQTRGFTASPELAKLLYQKVSKLLLLFDKIIVAEVKLNSDKSRMRDGKVCNIRLVIPGYDLMASAECKTFECAIADAVEALKIQIEKRKTQLSILRKST